MAYTRGVLTTGAGTYGYVQSIEINDEGPEVLIKDETGTTKVEDLYDLTFTATVTAKFDRASTVPARGATVTLAASPRTSWNAKYTVTSVSVTEENTDAATVKLTLRRFSSGAIPA